MPRLTTPLGAAAGALLLASATLASVSAPPRPSGPATDYGKLPLGFEANAGQADAAVRYLARGPHFALLLGDDAALFDLVSPSREHTRIRMSLASARRRPHIDALEPQVTRTSYLVGADPELWHTGIRSFGRISYRGVYPGVDLVFHGDRRALEYDFVVAAGARTEAIRLAFEGVESLDVDASGDLVLRTASGDLVQRRPVAYQYVDGRRVAVESRYVLAGARQIGFAIGSHDRRLPLVIDPVLLYSTYFGSTDAEGATAIAVDGDGDAYITGYTSSASLLVTPGVVQDIFGGGTDAFVMKLDPLGTTVVYSTFVGGNFGDIATAIAVDDAGSAYVAGATSSTGRCGSPRYSGFPGVCHGAIQASFAGGTSDAFAFKLSPAGDALTWATLLGGSGRDAATGIAVDGGGNAVITGYTDSPSFPGVGAGALQPANQGSLDAFVAKIDATGSALVYSTFMGGTGDDTASGVAVDALGNAYVTGTTSSPGMPAIVGPPHTSLQPANAGGTDAFVVKIDPTGSSIPYSTLYGSTGADGALGIAVDGSGAAYVTGESTSLHLPGIGASAFQHDSKGNDDAFVLKMAPDGTAFAWATFYGGDDLDRPHAIAVDAVGDAWIAGETDSDNLPGIGPVTRAKSVDVNGFLAEIDPAGSHVLIATLLGGSMDDPANGVALDTAGGVYVTGTTDSSNFFVNAAVQGFLGGATDAFVGHIADPCGIDIGHALCLNNARFRVTATYDAGGGNAGKAHAVRLTSDTGYFWFFGKSNVEVVLKVLDGCGVNSKFWVYAGGLTDVNVVIEVTDTFTGASKTYTNPSGRAFQPIEDSSAFGTCSKVSVAPSAIVAAATNAAAADLRRLVESKVAAPAAAADASPQIAGAKAGCSPTSAALCLDGSRFRVTATYDAGGGNAGSARALQLTPDTGYLWFFQSSNVETVIKVLNGCGVNLHHWVYAGGLTDVRVVITVTDTQTGKVKTYTNPRGTPFRPIEDTSAFAACP